MDIKSLKFTEDMFAGKDISSMPDSPSDEGISAAELKAWFDMVPKMMVALGGFNSLIDALTEAAGAANIGLSVEGLAAGNVQEGMAELAGAVETVDGKAIALEAAKADKATTYTKTETDGMLDGKADKTNVLIKGNTEPFTPTLPYDPAPKVYVDAGGAAGEPLKLKSATITLDATGWAADGGKVTKTVMVAGLLASDMVHQVAPSDASYDIYTEAGVRAKRVSVDGSLTFVANETPMASLTVNITQLRNWGDIDG